MQAPADEEVPPEPSASVANQSASLNDKAVERAVASLNDKSDPDVSGEIGDQVHANEGKGGKQATLARPTTEEFLPDQDNNFIIRLAVILIVFLVFPCLCRFAGLSPAIRCLVLTISILMMNSAEVMPLYCTALMVPVLGTLFSVLGDERTTTETSTLLVQNVFNNTSFMVLGALAINAVFTKCGLDLRFMAWLLRSFRLDGPAFLFVLIFGGMFMCSVLYSGSLVLLAALEPVLMSAVKSKLIDANASKRILLAVSFCANAGSCLLPISSPVNLIAVSLLADFGFAISVNTWAAIAVPVAVLTMFGTFLVFLIVFPTAKAAEEASEDETWNRQLALVSSDHVELTDWHLVFLGVGVMAVLGITVYPTQLEPIIGHPAILSLAVVVVVFGSGFMSRDEFCQLDWDLLALVGGINVMAFLIRETGLGMLMSNSLEQSGLLDPLPYQAILALLTGGTMLISTFLGHSITGVLLLPLVIALGIKLHAPQTTGIIVAAAVPFGMGWFNASFDNIICYNGSKKFQRKAHLQNSDFRRVGCWTSIFAWLLLCTLGHQIAVHYYGPPGMDDPLEITHKNLKPKVVRENLPGAKDWAALEPQDAAMRKPGPESARLLARAALVRGPLRGLGEHSGAHRLRRQKPRPGFAPQHLGLPQETRGETMFGQSSGEKLQEPGVPENRLHPLSQMHPLAPVALSTELGGA